MPSSVARRGRASYRTIAGLIGACLVVAACLPTADAATVWNKTYLNTSNTNPEETPSTPYWWFDDYTAPNGTLEAPNGSGTGADAGNENTNWSGGHRTTDYHINYGYNLTNNVGSGGNNNGEGVVYDPDNDPFDTGMPSVGAVAEGDEGQVTLESPFTAQLLYMTTTNDPLGTAGPGTQATNRLTIKSGELRVARQIRMTRTSVGTGVSTSEIIQTGGTFVLVDELNSGYMQLGDGDQASGTVHTVRGVYDYRGGTAEFALNSSAAAGGIRLGSQQGPNPNVATSRHQGVVIINPDDTNAGNGHFRTRNYHSGYGNIGDGVSIDTDYSLGQTFFHYQNAGSGWDGTRAIQVTQNLSIRNLPDTEPNFLDGRSEVDVVIDEAPTTFSGGDGSTMKPINLVLFDVDSDNDTVGIIQTGGALGPDRFYPVVGGSLAHAVGSGLDHLDPYLSGDIVEATFGGETYRWKIYYSGNVTWTDQDSQDNSIIADPQTQITGADTGRDIVLIGWSSTIPDGGGGILGDLNDDGFVDDQDIDILWNVIRPELAGDDDPGANDDEDLNGDGFVNEDDVDFMLAGLLDAGPNRQYGDADLDGGVGGLDYTAWRQRAGTGWANGDFDGDGGVGGLDYTLWRTRPTAYPTTVGPHPGSGGPQIVPEPASLVLLGLGLPALALLARRRKTL